jgi:hypothetical protein
VWTTLCNDGFADVNIQANDNPLSSCLAKLSLWTTTRTAVARLAAASKVFSDHRKSSTAGPDRFICWTFYLSTECAPWIPT